MTTVVVDLERLKFLQCGLGQFSLHLGQALLDEAGSDIEPILLLPQGCESLFPAREFQSITAKPWRKAMFTAWLRPIRSRITRQPAVDVWHVTHQDSKFWPLDSRVPVVLTIHDLNFLREKSESGIRRRLSRLQQKVSRATLITTGSDYSASEIREHLHTGDRPIQIIPHGVCLDRSALPQSPSGLEGLSNYLFTIGDITPKKNFHTLVELLPQLPEYSLVVAGSKSSDYAAGIERRAREIGVADRVILPGRVSEAERNWLYEHCSAFLFPSLTEGFGLPLIEAMSFARPVFSSRNTSLPEVGGPLAFYWNTFEPDDMVRVFRTGMRQFESDPNYGGKLRSWANGFRWPVAARRYLEVYRQAAKSRGLRRAG